MLSTGDACGGAEGGPLISPCVLLVGARPARTVCWTGGTGYMSKPLVSFLDIGLLPTLHPFTPRK